MLCETEPADGSVMAIALTVTFSIFIGVNAFTNAYGLFKFVRLVEKTPSKQ